MKKYTIKRLSLFNLIILFSFAILCNSIAEAKIMRAIVAGATGGVVAGAVMGSMAKKEASPAVTNGSEVFKVMCYANSHKIVKTANGRMLIYGSKNAFLIDVPSNSQYIIQSTIGLESCNIF